MSRLRERFETIPEIERIIDLVYFDEVSQMYEPAYDDVPDSLWFIQGAWFMFQELNK